MKILCAAHNAGRVGGIETYLGTIVPALQEAGHDVACWFEQANESLEPVVDPDLDVRIWTADQLDDVRRWSPDVIYAHGFQSPDHERALLGIAPAVLFVHAYYGTCISGTKLHRLPHEAVCTRRFGPACLALFYPRRCGGWNPATMLRLYALQRTRLRTLSRYRRLVVASRHMALELEKHGLVTPGVLGLPVLAGPPVPQTAPRTGDAWRLAYIGRLEWTKGADIALESAATAADASARPVVLTMMGVGSLEHRLRARARQLGDAGRRLAVSFTGWVDAAQRAEHLRRTDLLLVPSRWPEPLALVGVEAGLHGVPSVAFRRGGVTEWLHHEVNGCLVEPGPRGSARFAAAIVRCLAEERRLKQMRLRARELALRRSLAAHVEALDAILTDAANR